MAHVFMTSGKAGQYDKCNICGMKEEFHEVRISIPAKPLVECECCSNKVEKLEQIGSIKMCASCFERENSTRVGANITGIALDSPVMNDKSLLQQSVIIDSALKVHEDFFNAETIAIAELAKAALSKAELFDAVKTRQTEFQAKLIDVKEAEINLNSRIRASQQALYDLVKQLTEKERADRKITDIAYNPPEHKKEKAPTAPKVKMTAQEKMAQNLMNARWGKVAERLMKDEGMDEQTARNVAIHRGLVITIEQARIEVEKIFAGE